MLSKQLIQAAAGNAGADNLYVEDVFSTFHYNGTGSTQTITNGIDLNGEGGLTWVKRRDGSQDHVLQDTERGTSKFLRTNTAGAQSNAGTVRINAFNSDGFSVGGDADVNFSSQTYASWTFRKAEKFFDVVTYTGTSSAQSIAHNLGSVPGFVIVKRLDTDSTWRCWHRSLPSANNVIHLNEYGPYETNTAIWNGTAPTSTHFTVGTNSNTNTLGGTYVAYLFAHDAGGFGEDGTESIIKCGIYTGNNTSQSIDLGWEPQWVLLKNINYSNSDWHIFSPLQNFAAPGTSDARTLSPNLNGAETNKARFHVQSKGFEIDQEGSVHVNQAGQQYIYVAIRRTMKVPTDATTVFNVVARNGTGVNPTFVSTGLTNIDVAWPKNRGTSSHPLIATRRQYWYAFDERDSAEQTYVFGTSANPWADSSSIIFTTDGDTNGATSSYINYFFKTAPGFLDIVSYNGNGSWSARPHNLGVTPELVIQKSRKYADNWNVWAANQIGYMNSTGAWSASSMTHTSTTFSPYTDNSSDKYINYLFASCPGVSKVGTYSGNGSTQNIECGFSGGARFVLIRNISSGGDWYIHDSTRGIGSGNDPFWTFWPLGSENTTTDHLTAYSGGFGLTNNANVNTSGDTYLFLAIA